MFELLQVIATGIHEQGLLGLVDQNYFAIRKQGGLDVLLLVSTKNCDTHRNGKDINPLLGY
jgi:hypothetical protein